MHPQYHQYDPLRQPNWRAERVLELREGSGPKRPSKYDDEYVRTYLVFKREWDKGRSNARRNRLFMEHPGLMFAHQLHVQRDAEWRHIIEARILAHESNDIIAEEISTIPETIEWYEKLFYNVRDRLHNRTYITKAVLGSYASRVTGMDSIFTDWLRGMLYRIFAYYGGPLIFDIVLSGFTNSPYPDQINRCDEWFDNALRTAVRSRASQTAQIMAITKFDCMQLLEIACSLAKDAEEARRGGGDLLEFQRNVEVLLENAKLSVGDSTLQESSQATIRFSHTAVEPRAHEMQALAVDQVPPALENKNEILAFPKEEETKNAGADQ